MGESFAPSSAGQGAIEPEPPCSEPAASSELGALRGLGSPREDLVSLGDEPGGLWHEPGVLRNQLGVLRNPLGVLRNQLGVLRNHLGVLRNGLGSIRNLELLIKSIKVGQKGLFAAVSAVHADCASMIANAQTLGAALRELGVDASCAERLSGVIAASLEELEGMLAAAVATGRLSVSQRLKLERDLSRCARDLGATLPLVDLIERASRPRPAELTPVELVHASSADRSEEKSVVVYRSLPPDAVQYSLNVDLEAAKSLLAIAVALVTEGQPQATARVAFDLESGGAPVSLVTLSSERPGAPSRPEAPLSVTPLRLCTPSVLCAEVAARRLGGRFEYSREARRVSIYWPMA